MLKSKPLMLIVEGPDGVGKTTAVNKLANDLSAKIVKGVRIPDRFMFLHSTLNDISEQLMRTRGFHAESVVIFDRWTLISDLIYEKYIYGRRSIMESILPILPGVLQEANIRIVFIDISKEEIKRRYEQRGDLLRTLDEILEAQEAYRAFFQPGCPLKYWKLDVTGMTEAEVVDELRWYVEEGMFNSEEEQNESSGTIQRWT